MTRALAILLFVAFGTATARAQPAHEALFFDDLARREFAANRYGEAYRHFAHLAQLVDTPGNLYNLGLSAALADRPAIAYAHLSEYLARDGLDPERRADALHRVDALRGGLALVSVRSVPPGATIEVTGADVGAWGVTPRTIAVPPGTRTIRLTRDRHRSAEREVEAIRGELSELDVRLAVLTGRLRIDADVETASVRALGPDGVVVEGAAGEPLSLPMGRWDVHITAPTREPVLLTDVMIQARVMERRSVVLPPERVPTGTLLVDTQGVRARVRIDGRPRAETPARLDNVRAGRRRIAVRAEGYAPWLGEVDIEEDHTRFLDVTLMRVRR